MHKTRSALLAIWLMFLISLVLASSSAFAQSLNGSFSHITDSDGTRPKKGRSVVLTFTSTGRCHIEATDSTGGEEPLIGDGTFSAQGGRITMSVPEVDIAVNNKPYMLHGDVLTLPFKVFNEGEGVSQWARIKDSTPMPEGASIPRTPPPTPEDQKNDINKPAPPPPPPPQKVGGGMKDELLCTCTDKTYDTPVEVLRNCTRPSLGKPMCGAVLKTTQQPCTALQNAGGFKTLYDQVVLGRPGPMGASIGGVAIPATSAANNKNPHTILVGTLISTYYRPWTPADFYMTVQSGRGDDPEYAKVEELTSKQHHLTVRGAAFTELSPAGLIASIGHEMIHAEQMRRPNNKVMVPGLGSIIAAMNELEASSWETQKGTFGWKIGPNKLWSCERGKERDFSSILRSCREWQVRELLVDINKSTDRQQWFADWVDKNPWARANWLPSNRGWRNVKTPAASSLVPFPRTRNDKVDCKQVLGMVP